MDFKRKTIEDFKKQISEGKFASNNDLVLAIRELYNDAKVAASSNPLLEQFLREMDYTAFTKDVTTELVEYYKQYKEQEKTEVQNLSDVKIEGQTIDSSQISQVNTGDITYYKIKDGDGDYSVYASTDDKLISNITAAAIGRDEDINHIAKEVIDETKIEVDLTGLEQFEKEKNLSFEDHTQAALARSMETYTGNEMAVNADHNIILNTDNGDLSKIDENGKVITYDGSSIEGPSTTNGEQFVLSDDILSTLSIEDINLMLSDPEKYNLSPDTIEGLKVARDSKTLEITEKPKVQEFGFQKILKPPTNFKTSAFIDILLVALVCLSFSSIVLLRILLSAGV